MPQAQLDLTPTHLGSTKLGLALTPRNPVCSNARNGDRFIMRRFLLNIPALIALALLCALATPTANAQGSPYSWESIDHIDQVSVSMDSRDLPVGTDRGQRNFQIGWEHRPVNPPETLTVGLFSLHGLVDAPTPNWKGASWVFEKTRLISLFPTVNWERVTYLLYWCSGFPSLPCLSCFSSSPASASPAGPPTTTPKCPRV